MRRSTFLLIVFTALLAQGLAHAQIVVDPAADYFEDFESGAGGWTATSNVSFIDWELGTPTSPGDPVPSGVNAWATDLDADHAQYGRHNLTSPVFDFSRLTEDPLFSFKATFDIGGAGSNFFVRMRIDGGSWVKVGTRTARSWYNNVNDYWTGQAQPYREYAHILEGSAGAGSVELQIRFLPTASSFTTAGVALDDVRLDPSPPRISLAPGDRYFEDFESSDHGWWADDGADDDLWDLGTPTAPNDPVPSGVNAWVTNRTGQYGTGDDASVRSPRFDFSGLTDDPIFEFELTVITDNGSDGLQLEMSVDGGPFTRVGTRSDPSWYHARTLHFGDAWTGNHRPFQRYRHALDGAAGSDDVRLRLRFRAYVIAIARNGVAFDDVSIDTVPCPGTESLLSDDITQIVGLNGSPDLGFGHRPQAGDILSVTTLSPNGDLFLAPLFVLAELFTNGSPPSGPLAGVCVTGTPGTTVLIAGGPTAPIGQDLLLGLDGFSYGFVVPSGFTGFSMIAQSLVTAPMPQTANGIYATTNGHTIVLP